jgi:hypothetical protein
MSEDERNGQNRELRSREFIEFHKEPERWYQHEIRARPGVSYQF